MMHAPMTRIDTRYDRKHSTTGKRPKTGNPVTFIKAIVATFLMSFSMMLCAAETIPGTPPPAAKHTTVRLSTTLGDIVLQLEDERAPESVKNFLDYVNSGFYDGLIFHRVIPNFMIQGGGFDQNMIKKATKAPIKNEAKNGLANIRGSIAMARTPRKDSATSQFFINLVDNKALDHNVRGYGYAVFGKVVSGLDVVDKIAAQPTGQQGVYGDVPKKPIVINSAKVVTAEE